MSSLHDVLRIRLSKRFRLGEQLDEPGKEPLYRCPVAAAEKELGEEENVLVSGGMPEVTTFETTTDDLQRSH